MSDERRGDVETNDEEGNPMKTSVRKNKLRDHEDRLKGLRWRVGYVYGLKVDVEQLDDDELDQLDALTTRLIERPLVHGGYDPDKAITAANARRYAEGIEKLIDEQPVNIQASLREQEAAELAYVRKTGTIPSKPQQAALRKGEIQVDAIGDASFEIDHPPIRWGNLDEEETMTLETLAARAAGLKPTHFADLRAVKKIRQLARRVSEPRWQDSSDAIAAVMSSELLAKQAAIVGVFDAPDLAVLYWALARIVEAGGEEAELDLQFGGICWPRRTLETLEVEEGKITVLGGVPNIVMSLKQLQLNGWLAVDGRRVSLGPNAVDAVDAYRRRIAKWKAA